MEKPQKRVLLYGKPAQRISDLMGHATVVMFSPEDLRIVRDGPAAGGALWICSSARSAPAMCER